MFANEHDIDNWVRLFGGDRTAIGPEPDEMGEAHRAALNLQRLKDWTNSCSDGWPYWKKPSNAAKRLIELLRTVEDRIHDGDFTDATTREVDAALTPIKSFLTRREVDWREVLL